MNGYQRFGARGLGVDIEPVLVETAQQNAAEANVQNLVQFRKHNWTLISFFLSLSFLFLSGFSEDFVCLFRHLDVLCPYLQPWPVVYTACPRSSNPFYIVSYLDI